MNGNPTVQAPMPPPPPHHFPNAGPQYHHGPPPEQMTPQTSPHLQNFPSPGGASHNGLPQPGPHPNMPSHMGQNRPMEINQGGGRPMGPRQSFDGLADRLDKLNIDPTSPRKRKEPMDQNVVDVNRHSGTKADSTVMYEGWTLYRAEPETVGQNPSWARAKKNQMLLPQNELAKLVQRRKKKGQTAAEQYKSLGIYRRAQVDRLIEDRKRQDADPRFEWHCMYVDSTQKNVGRHGLFEMRYETISMDVIIMKKLRPNVSPAVLSPKVTGKRFSPEVVDIHSPGTPTLDSDSDFDKPLRGGNKHGAHPGGAIPLGPSQGPPPLRRDMTMGPDRPLQGMPQGGQRPSAEMNPHIRMHEQNPHGQDGRMHDMPRGGPQAHQRGPEMNPQGQPQPPQGQTPHGPQIHQQPQPMMNPHAPPHPQNPQGPDRRMQGMPQGGPPQQQQPQQQHPQHQQPQQQHPQQRGPPDMHPHGLDERMHSMPRGGPQGHPHGPPKGRPQGPPGMNHPHAPVPPPAVPNPPGQNHAMFGQNPPIQVINGAGQPPQIPQMLKDFPKEHHRQKSAPKVVNLTGKSPRDKGVEKWLDEESSLDEDDSELFELEDDSSATEDSYNIDEKFERHIPGRGSLHPSRRSSRSRGRNEPGYRNHRRTGHRYTGSDGHRYRHSRDLVDIVPARTNRALLPPPTRRASVAGPVRAPPRLMYGDRIERRDPISTIAGASFSPTRYKSRELEYPGDERDLDLDRDRELDYNEYMRDKLQEATDDIRLRRRAAKEAEYRELKEESERMERLERMERMRRPLREHPRYGGRGLVDYD